MRIILHVKNILCDIKEDEFKEKLQHVTPRVMVISDLIDYMEEQDIFTKFKSMDDIKEYVGHILFNRLSDLYAKTLDLNEFTDFTILNFNLHISVIEME